MSNPKQSAEERRIASIDEAGRLCDGINTREIDGFYIIVVDDRRNVSSGESSTHAIGRFSQAEVKTVSVMLLSCVATFMLNTGRTITAHALILITRYLCGREWTDGALKYWERHIPKIKTKKVSENNDL